MDNYLVIDIETTSLNPRRGEIISASALSSKTGEVRHTRDINVLKSWCAANCPKVFHNALFEMGFFTQKDIPLNGELHDTMLLAWLHNPDRPSLKLKDLATEILGEDSIRWEAELQSWLKANNLSKDEMFRAPKDLIEKYNNEDVINTDKLFKHFGKKLGEMKTWLTSRGHKKTPLDYYREEMQPLLKVILNMQLGGVKLDLEETARKKEALARESLAIARQLTEENQELITKIEEDLLLRKIEDKKKRSKTGNIRTIPPTPKFNWDSNDHLKRLFFGKLKEKPTKQTKKGNDSIDDDALQALIPKYPWVANLLKYKAFRKLSSTYLDNLIEMQEGGLIHASFNLTGTATGRFSSNKPNLQNLPKSGNIKSLFVPRRPNNIFIYADYSQLELRLAAHLSQDPILIKAYREGLDLHQTTADIIGCERALGKTVNFAIIYNASGWRIAEILGYMEGIPLDDIESKMDAARKGDEIIKELFGHYEGLKKYFDRERGRMLKTGMVISEFGLVRRLPELRSSVKKEFNHALKAGFNFKVQSFGASLTKRAMVELARSDFRIVSQIHDSIIIECNALEREKVGARVKAIMEGIYPLTVPLIAEPKFLTSFEEKD